MCGGARACSSASLGALGVLPPRVLRALLAALPAAAATSLGCCSRALRGVALPANLLYLRGPRGHED